MKLTVAPALAALLSACSPTPTPVHSPSPRAAAQDDPGKKFILQMKVIDRQAENLQIDFAERKPDAAMKERLRTIRQASIAAAAIPYRAIAAENRDLKLQFDFFLSTLDQLEKESWTGEDAARNYKRLETACTVCHSLYRTD